MTVNSIHYLVQLMENNVFHIVSALIILRKTAASLELMANADGNQKLVNV